MQLLGGHRRDAGGCRDRQHRMGPGQRTRVGQHLRPDRLRDRADRARGRQRARRNHRRRALIAEVVDGGDIDDTRAVYRHDILGGGSEPRAVRLAWPQGHPADVAGGECGADRHADANPQERDQRGGVDRVALVPFALEFRRPAPAAVQFDPAAIVERRETPAGIVDPGPAPGLDEGPMSLAIGDPSRLDRGVPDLPIFPIVVPDPVALQVVAARQVGDARRWRFGVGRRWRRQPRAFPRQPRTDEGVGLGGADGGLECVCPGDGRGLPGG